MPRTTNRQTKKSTYLRQLKFDPRLTGSFIAGYFTNLRLVLLIVLTLVFAGLASYLSLPRNLNPEIKIPLVIVTTVLPGASPAEMESLVSVPIEDAVNGLAQTKKIQSTSRDSVSIVTVEFQSGVEIDKARQDVQTAVDGLTDLPTDAQAPKVIKLDFENQPVWSFSLSSQGDQASLFRFANRLKDDLENLPSVNRVEIAGTEEQEIQILIKPEVLTTYHLSPQQLTQAVKGSLKALPAGNIETENSTFILSIDPAVLTVDDLRKLKVNLGMTVANLGDIAQVQERAKPSQQASFVAAPQTPARRAVSFNVYRTSNVPIEQAVHEAQHLVETKVDQGNFQVYSVIDYGNEIKKQFDELQRDLLLTVGLVVFILFIFLGLKQSLVSAFTAPMTFFITFIVMHLAGISLSFIAIFSLLLSLGLLVDDAIVVISAMTAYYRSGKFTPLETALLVWRDFLIPVLTTTMTTVWAFIPLLLATGIIGEFIKPIPVIVSSTLLASIFTALFITFPLITFLLKPRFPNRVLVFGRIFFILATVALFTLLIPKDNNLVLGEILAFLLFLLVTWLVRRSLVARLRQLAGRGQINRSTLRLAQARFGHGLIDLEIISYRYKTLILRILRSPAARVKTLAMVVLFSLFAYLLLPVGLVRNEFFPKTDVDYLYASIELPPGTNLATTQTQAQPVLEKLRKTPGIDFVLADSGKAFSMMSGIGGGENNQVLFSLKLLPERQRTISSMEVASQLRREFADFTPGKFTVTELSHGPPAGADLQIKLFGPDLKILDDYANRLVDYLNQQPGITNVEKSIKPGTSKLVFVPDRQKLAENNLAPETVGYWLRLYASGLTADKIKLEGETHKKDINLRFSSQPQAAASLGSLLIPTAGGNVPLLALGTVKLESNPTLITREDGQRTLSVSAGMTQGYSVSLANRQLESFVQTLNLPAGYHWQTGGLNEENQNSVNSILQAMLLSFILIVATMIVQFASFRKAVIIILVIPLSVAGVFIVFGLTQTPLSFPALVGVLALFGIVVKNSILVVDKITVNIKTGMEFTEAIADGAASRLEPIALTSMAAISGLIPITLSSALWRGLGGAIIAGLTFSGTIMLLFIPVVYYLMFKPRTKNS